MHFLEKYKRLDNLCKDLLNSDKGVTTYIDSMDECGYTARGIPGWESDYKNLKKYRHIRNQIVHENGMDESHLCVASDEKWLEQFYERIMKQNDPLALYEKAKRGSVSSKKKRNLPENTKWKTDNTERNERKTEKSLVGIGILVISVIGVMVLLFIVFLLWSVHVV